MSTRYRIPIFAAAASAAALLLAGWSSWGIVGSSNGSSEDSSGGFTGGTGGKSDSGGASGGFSSGGSSSGGSSSGSSSSGGSSGGALAGGADPGCAAALVAIQNAERLQSSSDPKVVISGIRTSISQLHSAADKAKKPGAKQAINKVADDLQGILSQAQSGKNPDSSKALTDAEAVAEVCEG